MKFLKLKRQGSLTDINTAAYLYKMATHTALNSLRSGGRRNKNEKRGAMPLSVVGHEGAVDRLAVQRLLTQVPEELATMAAYYYIDGLEQEEIAELTGLGRRTVGRRLEDFMRRARRILGVAS